MIYTEEEWSGVAIATHVLCEILHSMFERDTALNILVASVYIHIDSL